MKKIKTPRILIGATGSGVGKTTIVCGLLRALQNREKKVVSFKCGPDYIDPMFHKKVLNIASSNLDLFFYEENTLKHIMNEHILSNEAEIAVIEGVMGYYDGLAGISSEASSFHLGRSTKTPTILVVDGRGKSVSLLAEIKGFLEWDKENTIKGVIVNKMSPMMYAQLKPMIEEKLNIKALGCFPKSDDIALESRHLGLITAEEINNLDKIINRLGELAEKHLDMDEILKLSTSAEDLDYEPLKIEKMEEVNVAVAMDKAFSFYYDANIKLLEDMGANIKYFSPINQEDIPKDSHGILIGGGYPELYLRELEKNVRLKESIVNLVKSGIPLHAECGGFMYLHQWIEDEEGRAFNMVGLIQGGSFPTGKLGRFGYINLETKEETLFGERGTPFKGHEFHYWDSQNTGSSTRAKKPLRTKSWDCIHSFNNVFAGYPHISYYSNPKIAKSFYEKMLAYKKTQENNKDV